MTNPAMLLKTVDPPIPLVETYGAHNITISVEPSGSIWIATARATYLGVNCVLLMSKGCRREKTLADLRERLHQHTDLSGLIEWAYKRETRKGAS